MGIPAAAGAARDGEGGEGSQVSLQRGRGAGCVLVTAVSPVPCTVYLLGAHRVFKLHDITCKQVLESV